MFPVHGKMLKAGDMLYEKRVQTILATEIDFTDSRVPQRIYERVWLFAKSPMMSITIPSLFKFNTITQWSDTTGTSCDCLICQMGKLKLNEKHPLQETDQPQECRQIKGAQNV